MATLSKDVVIRLLGDASSANAAIKSAADAAEVSVAQYKKAERELGKQQQAEATALKQRREMQEDLGRGAMVMGAALVAGFAMAVKSAAEFDKEMSAVGAATMATAGQMDQLRQAALDAGATTMYSATEAARAETELAKAGVSVADILGGGLAGALDLAAAGQMDVADAAEIAATQMTVFKLAGSATGHVADLLAAGAGKAQGSVADLGKALEYAGLPAAGLGMSVEDTAGTLALFASNGLVGEKAGTAFRGMLVSMTNPAAKTRELMDELGVSFYDANGEFIGMDGVAGVLTDRLGGLTTETRNAALAQIFGNEAIGAAQALYNAGSEGVEEWNGKVNDAGYAAEQAAKLTDNLAGDVERLGGALSTAFITGGGGATDSLRWMTQAATGAVNAYTALPDPIEGTVAALAGLAGGGLVALGVVASLGVRIGEFRDRLGEMGPAGEKADAAIGKIGGWAAKAGMVAGLAVAIWEVGQAAVNAAVDFFDLDNGASDVADALSEIDTGAVQSSLNELADSGRSVGFLASAFGSVSDAVREMDNNLGRSDSTVEYRANIQALDSAFASMMSSGQIDEAAAAFSRLALEQIRQGGTADEILMQLPQYNGALQEYVDANSDGEEATGGLTEAQQVQIGALEEAATTVDDLKDALEGLNGITRSVGENQAAWTLGLGDLRDALAENGATIDTNTEAGAKNYQAIASQAEQAEKLAEAVFNSTGSYEEFSGSLATSRQALVDTMHDMGFSEEAAWALTDSILAIPPKAPTTATMDTGPAAKGRDDVLGMINTLNLTPATIQVKANTRAAIDDINQVINGTYTATIRTQVGRTSQSDILGSIYNVGAPPRATGGAVRAGQVYKVGEQGPEFVQFGAHGYVTPADLTRQAMAAAGSAVAGAIPTAPGIPVGQWAGQQSAATVSIDYARLAAAVGAGRTGGLTVENMHVTPSQSPGEIAAGLAFLARTGG